MGAEDGEVLVGRVVVAVVAFDGGVEGGRVVGDGATTPV